MNPAVAAVPPSLIRAIHARKRPGDVDLGLGEPTLRPDPAPFEAATAWVREHGCPYSPNAGFPELREAVARYLASSYDEDDPAPPPAADGVCVTVGSEEALFAAIHALVDPARDEVLTVEPSYLAYPKICTLLGVRHRAVALDPEDGFRPRADLVLDALRKRTRLVVLCSPTNPTGRVWSEAELRALAAGLAERDPPVWVLADEVYRELWHGPEPPVSVARLHPHSLVAGSLSKSNALTGLRLGWLAGPAEAVAAATRTHQFAVTAADTFAQRVALEVFSSDDGVAAHRPHYRERRDLLLRLLSIHGLPHVAPEGAFYCMVRLPPPLAGDSVAAVERLLEEERVVAVPGRAFGGAAEGWLRLSWVAPPDELGRGIEGIARFFARHR